MNLDEWIKSPIGFRVVEAMAEVLFFATGQADITPPVTWVQIAEGHKRAYRELATEALLAALAVGEQPCLDIECGCGGALPKGKTFADESTLSNPIIIDCPSCHGTDSVPGVPAIIDAVMEQVTDITMIAISDRTGEAAWCNPDGLWQPVYRLRRPEERP